MSQRLTLRRYAGPVSKLDAPSSAVPCEAVIPACGGWCCTGLTVTIAGEDLEDGLEPALPVVDLIKLSPSGACAYLDPQSKACTVWPVRPLVCRTYSCEGDDRVMPDLMAARKPTPPHEQIRRRATPVPVTFRPLPAECRVCQQPLRLCQGVSGLMEGRWPCLFCGVGYWVRHDGVRGFEGACAADVTGVLPWRMALDLGRAHAYLCLFPKAVSALRTALALAQDRTDRLVAGRALAVAMAEWAARDGAAPPDTRMEALRFFRERHAEAADLLETWWDLGWVLWRGGRHSEAEAVHEQAAARWPYHLGLALDRFINLTDWRRFDHALGAVRLVLADALNARDMDFTCALDRWWTGADADLRVGMARAAAATGAGAARTLVSRGVADPDLSVAHTCRDLLNRMGPFPALLSIGRPG